MILPFLYFSMTFVSNTITQRPQVSERLYTGQKEVSAASDGGESRQADDLFPNGPLWDGHVKSAVLCTENRIALVSQFVKVWVVRPHIHRKFKLADEARTANERGDTSLYASVGTPFVRMAKNDCTCFDGWARAGRRLHSRSLDDRL